MRWSAQKTVALLGTIILIPWDLFMGFGYTFSFKGNEPILERVFVWSTFYLTVPAVLVSWVFPRLGAYWILVNTAVSFLLQAIHQLQSYLAYRRSPYPLTRPLPVIVLLEVFYLGLFFWFGKLAFSWCLLRFCRDGKATSEPPGHARA
jgi:hypothetical protein